MEFFLFVLIFFNFSAFFFEGEREHEVGYAVGKEDQGKLGRGKYFA